MIPIYNGIPSLYIRESAPGLGYLGCIVFLVWLTYFLVIRTTDFVLCSRVSTYKYIHFDLSDCHKYR